MFQKYQVIRNTPAQNIFTRWLNKLKQFFGFIILFTTIAIITYGASEFVENLFPYMNDKLCTFKTKDGKEITIYIDEFFAIICFIFVCLDILTVIIGVIKVALSLIFS